MFVNGSTASEALLAGRVSGLRRFGRGRGHHAPAPVPPGATCAERNHEHGRAAMASVGRRVQEVTLPTRETEAGPEIT